MSTRTATVHHIRAGLAEQVDSLTGPALRTAELATRIDDIRRIAMQNGLIVTVTVARAFEAALAKGGRGALVPGWAAMLRDSIDAEPQNGAACELFAAACAIRFRG